MLDVLHLGHARHLEVRGHFLTTVTVTCIFSRVEAGSQKRLGTRHGLPGGLFPLPVLHDFSE